MNIKSLVNNKLSRFAFQFSVWSIVLIFVILIMVVLTLGLVENQNAVYRLGDKLLVLMNWFQILKLGFLIALFFYWEQCVEFFGNKKNLTETSIYQLKQLRPYAVLVVVIIETLSVVF